MNLSIPKQALDTAGMWPDEMLHAWAAGGGVTPYVPAHVNPASIDLCWSGKVRRSKHTATMTVSFDDLANTPENKARRDELLDQMFTPEEDHASYVFHPGNFHLVSTVEYVKIPRNAAGLIASKSRTARIAVEQMHAGYFDPGFEGVAVLELVLFSPWRVRVNRGDRIVQMYMVGMAAEPLNDYSVKGHYSGQTGPEPAR